MTDEVKTITTAQELNAFLDSIPAGDLKNFQNKLMNEVGTTQTIFRNWKLNLTKVPIPSRKLMNALAMEKYNRKIFDV